MDLAVQVDVMSSPWRPPSEGPHRGVGSNSATFVQFRDDPAAFDATARVSISVVAVVQLHIVIIIAYMDIRSLH